VPSRDDDIRFDQAFNEIAVSRSLPPEVVQEALRDALVSAYRKDTNASKAQRIEADIDTKLGRPRIFAEKEVVDEVFSPLTEVTLEEARFYEPEADYGDTVMVRVGTTKNFGRIAAQAAKQVILQKIRQAERDTVYNEYISKVGEIVTGTVQTIANNTVTITLGQRAEAIMPRNQQIPGERMRPGDRPRVLIHEVEVGNRAPKIIVSRSHRNVLKRLLEFEVPEIDNGQVEIKNIAREAGGRSKVAVVALMDSIDPVGACVGMKGGRIQNIVKELNGEKIDVIEWSPNHEEFIKKALNPAQARAVFLDDDPDTGRTAIVLVPDDNLSQAIGREGQNARLAAKLTHWRIDIKSYSDAAMQAWEMIDSPELAPVVQRHAQLVEDTKRILDKRAAGLIVSQEEFTMLGRFAEVVEGFQLQQRIQSRQARLAEINALRATLPQQAFRVPVTKLKLPDTLQDALAPLENVGEILLRFLIDEKRIHRLLSGQPEGSLELVQVALDAAVIPEALEILAEPELDIEPDLDDAEDDDVDFDSAIDEQPAVSAPMVPLAADGAAFPDEGADDRRRVRKEAHVEPVEAVATAEVDDDKDLDEFGKPKSKGKKKKGRQLTFDEDRGEMVVKRTYKGGKRSTWEDEFE
jgi:N utilization substance protein A